jgi:hypothetical protein
MAFRDPEMRAFSDLPPPPPLLLLTCVIYSRKRPKCLWATSFLIDLFFSPQLLIDAELDEDVRTNNVCGTYKSLPLKRVRATSAPWFCPPGVLPAEPRVRGSLHRPASPHPLCAAPRMWSLLWRPRFLITVINANDTISRSNGQP